MQDRGNLQVNNIHVESLQDTASSSNSNLGTRSEGYMQAMTAIRSM
ncbi:hypothetical protein [Acinetobacter soli]